MMGRSILEKVREIGRRGRGVLWEGWGILIIEIDLSRETEALGGAEVSYAIIALQKHISQEGMVEKKVPSIPTS